MSAVTSHASYCIHLNPDLSDLDQIYIENQILALIGDEARKMDSKTDPFDNLDVLVTAAIQNGKIEDAPASKQILEAQLMNFATPLPSTINSIFWDKHLINSREATDWFYNLSKANNYIQTRAISKNLKFTTKSEYGDLEITINLSKPEKDPRAIAAAFNTPQNDQYPLCQLCMENEGYLGRIDYPARSNHRIVRFNLGGQTWGFQYSPYSYFSEHAIFLDQIHEPMEITRQTFVNLLTIISTFKDYFVGSNADIPLVGGSMLSHEHYQGGRHNFPMFKAPIEHDLKLKSFPNLKAGIVKWPMSVIRISSNNKKDLIDAAEMIREKWQEYSDESVGIRAYVNGERKHTVTPIAHRNGDEYTLEIVLRDNQTSEKYPDGIFHPHQDVQHIKKENIGLIEVMGLAILPGRLQTELSEVKKFLLNQDNEIKESHRPWAEELKSKQVWNKDNIEAQLNQAVGDVFSRVLEDAGVFKRDDKGKVAFMNFCKKIC